MASWDKGVRETWKSKDGRLAKETPSYSGASSSAAPWNSQPQQQRDHSSWAAAAVEQWTGSAATAAPSSPSTWWNQKKAPMEATLQTGFDPWTKSDPWQVSSTWASPSPEARALNSDQGQMDTQQSSTSMTQGRQLTLSFPWCLPSAEHSLVLLCRPCTTPSGAQLIKSSDHLQQ